MSQYLLFRAGHSRLLLRLELVVEISDRDPAHAGARRIWRERTLRGVDVARYLGAGAVTGRGQQVVVGRGDDLHAIDVDAVEGLVTLPEGRFAPLPEMSPALARLADAVATDAGGCLLRLREPLAWLAEATPEPTEPTEPTEPETPV